MQKKIIALAIAGLASTAAFAQTNVTIYGVADMGYAHIHNGGSKPQNMVESGLLSGSRIGFKGVEDLGNGLKALFTLEYAIAIDDNTGVGTTDAPWSGTVARQQFVGLTSNYGTVVAGRLQTAGYDFACAYNPLAGGAFDTSAKLGSATLFACGTNGRANNAVAYISPSFAGLTLALNHARVTEARNGTVAPDEKDSSATLGSLTYANGPVAVTGIFSKIYTTNDGIAGAGRNDVTEYGLGASFDAKVVKVFGTFQTNKVEALSSATLADKSDRKWQLGVSVPVTAAGSVLASYGHNSIRSTSADDNSWSAGVAYVHALSKRTKLYAGYNYLSNKDAATRGTAGGTTDVGGFATTLGAGINHSF